MLRGTLAVLLIALTPFATAAQAQTPAPVAGAEQQAPPRLRQRDLTETTLVSHDGLEYRILVSAPRGPAPEGGFPVFYILDGDAFFNTAVEIARMREWGRLTPSIIVGVAYPSRAFYDGPRRSYDFTPPGSADPGFDPSEVGGAGKFLAFLTGELKPWVRERYAVAADRQILFGHSLGGLFVLHAMFTAPHGFDIYLAASPTMRFSDSLIVREAANFASHPERASVRALITVGELESRPNLEQIDDFRRYFTANPDATGGLDVEEALRQMFVPNPNKGRATRRMAQGLSRSGADVAFAEFEGDEHLPAGVTALLRGIPFALRPAQPSRR